MAKIDDIDKVILRALQEDGRITNVDLAEKAGISAPPCLRRLKLMEQGGIISGYHADVNPSAFDLQFKAICIVTLSSQDSKEVQRFLNSVKKSKNIRRCFSTAGNENFIFYIVARDLSDYEAILQRDLQASGLISRMKTYIMVNTHKNEHGIPLQ